MIEQKSTEFQIASTIATATATETTTNIALDIRTYLTLYLLRKSSHSHFISKASS